MAEHRTDRSTRREPSDRRSGYRRSEHRRKKNEYVDEERRKVIDQRKGYQRKGNRRSGLDRREELEKGQ